MLSDIKINYTPDDSLRCMPEVLADEQEDEELRIIAASMSDIKINYTPDDSLRLEEKHFKKYKALAWVRTEHLTLRGILIMENAFKDVDIRSSAFWKEQYAQTVQCRTTAASMSDIKINYTLDDSLRCMPEVLADEQEDEELRIIAEQAGL